MTNSSLYTSFGNDFGPGLPSGYDFTLMFEDSILSILPSALLLLAVPIRVFTLWRKPRKVVRSPLYTNKLVFIAALACLQTTILILRFGVPVLKTQANLAASILALVDTVGLCWLSHAEHLYSLRPSAIINAYLLLSLLLDIVRARTLWLTMSTRSAAAVLSSAIGVKAMVLITEAIEKRHILLDHYHGMSPEETSGIYSLGFFFWLNNLMTTGFRRILSNEDLYPIADDLASKILYQKSQRSWSRAEKSKFKSNALLWSILRANVFAFCYPVLPRLCVTAFQYTQPFVISRTISFANSPQEPDSIGWGLTAAFGLVLLGLAIANGSYAHLKYRFLTSIRGSLITLVYSKTMDLSITELDESIAITLMSNDTETICQGFLLIHELWAVPLELALTCWLLYREIGISFLASAIGAILVIFATSIMSIYMANAQKIWLQGIQTRVDVTASMLSSMKMLGFTPILSRIVQNLRVQELKLSAQFRRFLCLRVFFGSSISAIGPFVTFAAFVIEASRSGKELDTAPAYTALSLITLLSPPMMNLCQAVPAFIAALACFTRIENFLRCSAREDPQLPAPKTCETDRNLLAIRDDGGTQTQVLIPLNPLLNPGGNLFSGRDASFSWSTEGTPTLHDLSFVIPRGQFSFIVGPVGSGKSTLIKGLLGETPVAQGFIYTSHPTTGFVDQSPWIRSGTVRQNILGISAYDETWYNQVVHACALERDAKLFPKGHDTPVGSAGISLSGGQKQRLALARCVYARKEFVILDDVFSGLDAGTEQHVFDLLLGKDGLFRRVGTTVLLATHAVHKLSYADHIIALDNTGKIIEQGQYEKLRHARGYIQSLDTRSRSEEAPPTTSHDTAMLSKPLVISAEAEQVESISDEIYRQSGDFAVYKKYFRSAGRTNTMIFMGSGIMSMIANKLAGFLLTYWTTAAAKQGNKVNNFYLGLHGMLTTLEVAGFVGAVLQLAMRMIASSAESLHAQLLHSVMNAPVSFFSKTDTGSITNRFSQDMTIIDTELPYALYDLTIEIFSTIMGAVMMCISAGYFAATMPPVILAVWVLQKYYLRTSRQMRLLDLEAKSPLYSHFIESLSGLVTIRAFKWEENFRELNLTLLDTSQKPYYLLFCIQRWLALILDLIVLVLALILMTLTVKLRTSISPGFVGLALVNVISFNSSLASLIKYWANLETSIGAISRLLSFATNTESEHRPGEIHSVPSCWPQAGSIEFYNLSASYDTSSNTKHSEMVLHDISLKIGPGEKIGICGRSGSGKSSLISVLFRMMEVTATSDIRVDNISLLTIPREIVRERLNAIPQEAFFLPGTVRSNADPYGRRTDLEVQAALDSVGLLGLIIEKGGLDADLDNEFFSHGQKQLFCLARAVLRKCPGKDGIQGGKILVLDEATSSVDRDTDELMQEIIRREFDGFTILAVAHRLDTILDFDRVVVLDKGEVVEVGNPRELLESSKGAFWTLYNS